MKLINQNRKFNLQFFARDGENSDSADDTGNDGDDNQDNEKSDEKTFTQAELDEAIKKRLERERKKAEKKQSVKDEESEEKPADKNADANNQKLTALEEKVLCYDHDIAKEYSKEAVALAKAYVDDDTDMDEALEKVIKKFPMFVKGAKTTNEDEEETDNKGSWGARQKGQSKKTSGIEDAFLKRNPGLKID